jgi:Ca2+-binding EF-hand superfamily protein
MTIRDDFLTILFRYFDVDSNSLITDKDIVEAFHKNGKEINIREAKKIIKSNQSSHDYGGFTFPLF